MDGTSAASRNRPHGEIWFGVLAALSAGLAQLLGTGQVLLLFGGIQLFVAEMLK